MLPQDDWLTPVPQADSSECQQSECCRALQQEFYKTTVVPINSELYFIPRVGLMSS